LNEAEAFLIIKPHYSSRVHGLSLYVRFLIPRHSAAQIRDFLGEVVSQARRMREAKSSAEARS
ncbi:MAG: hypothetical protein WA579_03840, partial [Rhodomicrobium sp.]